MESATQIIKRHGGEVVKGYELISNWGYTVMYKGTRYDVRRWANCYGSDCGWGVHHIDGEDDAEWRQALRKDLNNHEINSEW